MSKSLFDKSIQCKRNKRDLCIVANKKWEIKVFFQYTSKILIFISENLKLIEKDKGSRPKNNIETTGEIY